MVICNRRFSCCTNTSWTEKHFNFPTLVTWRSFITSRAWALAGDAAGQGVGPRGGAVGGKWLWLLQLQGLIHDLSGRLLQRTQAYLALHLNKVDRRFLCREWSVTCNVPASNDTLTPAWPLYWFWWSHDFFFAVARSAHFHKFEWQVHHFYLSLGKGTWLSPTTRCSNTSPYTNNESTGSKSETSPPFGLVESQLPCVKPISFRICIGKVKEQGLENVTEILRVIPS